MNSKEQIFHFKQFSCKHEKSAMKVGMDAVALGSWMSIKESGLIIDVGCGCGILALMYAQRSKKAIIYGIDIDQAAVEESLFNFRSSKWGDRLNVIWGDFLSFLSNAKEKKFSLDNLLYSNSSFIKVPFSSINICPITFMEFTSQRENNPCLNQKFRLEVGIENGCLIFKLPQIDHIVSNPPFFNAGVQEFKSFRQIARQQGRLSPYSLLDMGEKLLKPGGILTMIVPFSESEFVERYASEKKFFLIRKTDIKTSNKEDSLKRSMLEFRNCNYFGPYFSCLFPIMDEKRGEVKITYDSFQFFPEINILPLVNKDGNRSKEYNRLTEEFYLDR